METRYWFTFGNATHADEIPYVWDETQQPTDSPVKGLSLLMVSYMHQFHLTGSPGTGASATLPALPSGPAWPIFSNSSATVMQFDISIAGVPGGFLVLNPASPLCPYWQAFWDVSTMPAPAASSATLTVEPLFCMFFALVSLVLAQLF